MDIIIAPLPPTALNEIYYKLKTLNINNITLASTYTDTIPETPLLGTTLTQTAQNRALWWANTIKKPVIAEASGLYIKDLSNLPGHLSEIYSGTTDEQKNTQTLAGQLKLSNIKKSVATYICVCAIAHPGQQVSEITTRQGQWSGRTHLGTELNQGTDYDTIFETYIDRTWKLASELTVEEKSLYSHRGKAWREIIRFATT